MFRIRCGGWGRVLECDDSPQGTTDRCSPGDRGRVRDQTAPSMRADVERKFSSQKLEREHDPEKKRVMLATIGVPPGEFRRMSARDPFVRMMQRGCAAGGGFGGQLSRLRDEMADAEVESVEIGETRPCSA